MGYMLKNIMCYSIIIFTIVVWLLAINSFFGNGAYNAVLQTAPEWAEREGCYLMAMLLVQSGVLI